MVDLVDIYDMAQTWNAPGVPLTAISMKVTDTASDPSSLLLDLQLDGASKFSVGKDGLIRWSDAGGAGQTNYIDGASNQYAMSFHVRGNTVGSLTSDGFWTTGFNGGFRIGSHTFLRSDGDNILALRNGDNAQAFNIYNKRTDGSHYERAGFRWDADDFVIGTQAAGGGTARNTVLATSVLDKVIFRYASTRDHIVWTPYAGGGTTPWIGFISTMHLAWTNSATDGSHLGGESVGLRRVADGVLEVTNGELITANLAGGALAFPDAGELTIATGAVTVSGTFHTIDTESDAATDDLVNVNGGNDGQLLVIRPESGDRTVVAKNGTGNLRLAGDFSMDNAQATLTLMYIGALSAWVEISRSNNGA